MRITAVPSATMVHPEKKLSIWSAKLNNAKIEEPKEHQVERATLADRDDRNTSRLIVDIFYPIEHLHSLTSSRYC